MILMKIGSMRGNAVFSILHIYLFTIKYTQLMKAIPNTEHCYITASDDGRQK